MTQTIEKKISAPLKVLVVEDNNVDRRILEAMLKESTDTNSDLITTDSLSKALKILENQFFHVIVLDLNLPDSHGEDSLHTINTRFPEMAIVINTGAYEDDLGLKTLHYGAQDFLVKGKYNSYTLNKVLHYAVERKKLESELKQTSQRLEDAQNYLIQAEKMKVVGGLASGVAHEVKNPLATILYGVTFLSENIKIDNKDYQFVLTNIKEAIDRATNIINDLLDFSNLSRIKTESLSINTVIERALGLIKYDIDKHRIKIIKDLFSDIEEFQLDANRITQVLINIILNSIQAMEPERALTIRSFSQKVGDHPEAAYLQLNKNYHSSDKIAVIQIDDEGSGIPPENLDKIFDPFFTSKRAKGGVGLGLSVSKSIIETHGGQLIIRNLDDKGVRANLILKINNS
ncbi:MAG: response regulator [Candidatus Omnitrophica bacterium]|nr:response regulator [Candidatus Omnitrophota bacterium]